MQMYKQSKTPNETSLRGKLLLKSIKKNPLQPSGVLLLLWFVFCLFAAPPLKDKPIFFCPLRQSPI